MIFTIIFMTLSTYARPFEPGERPGPPPRRCDSAAVDACLNHHRAALGHVSAAYQIVNEKIAIIARDLQPVTQQHHSLAAEEKIAGTNERLARAEIDDISKPASPSSPLFPAGPTPENIFIFDNSLKIPSESFPETRKQRLQTIVVLSGNRVKELAPALRKLAMEISNLQSETEGLLRERSHLESAGGTHGRMCETGCREQICPDT